MSSKDSGVRSPSAGCGVFNESSTQTLGLKSGGADSDVIKATFAISMRTHAARSLLDPACFRGLIINLTSRRESLDSDVRSPLRTALDQVDYKRTHRTCKTTPHGCGFYSQKPVIRPYRRAKKCSRSTSIWITGPDRYALIHLAKSNGAEKSIHGN